MNTKRIEEGNNKYTSSKKGTFNEIPNPFIFGPPVRQNKVSRLFVGRLDIIREIESHLSNISEKPTIFLYGRRRIGKSSVLVNLPQYLSKQYIPTYIDCQSLGIRESNASFCFRLSKSISNSLKDNGFPLKYPSLEFFQINPFEFMGNWLDEIEKILKIKNKIILISLDEYEKLEESIIRGSISIEILDQFRNLIQNRKHFSILIAGNSELNELKLNWSDYFICTKTIILGHLSKDDARILITDPTEDFSLNYDGGKNGEVVNKTIDVTSCQPYLVQALCFELVNYLNNQDRKIARIDDIDFAIEKVLISAGNYFYYIWNTECSENERKFLKRLVNNISINGNKKEINSLMKKGIIEEINGYYKFKTELMRMWVEKNI